MKKIPILIISLALFLFFTPLVLADQVTGNLGGSGFVSGINGGVPNDPVASPASGYSASSAFSVSLTATNATTIRYTVDGSAPACPSTGSLYGGAITINVSKTVRAIACYDSGSTVPSNVVSFSYTISSGSGVGGGGGGGGNVTYCTAVTYSAWGTCVGTTQTRSVATRTPASCTLTTAQQISLQQTCTPASNTNTDTGAGSGTGQDQTSTPPDSGQTLINDILDEASIVSSNDVDSLLNHLGNQADQSLEDSGLTKYKKILSLDKTITNEEKLTINHFIVYGTRTTQRLGAGERAAVVNSYFNAYGKLPNSYDEWADLIKIANGRWPVERSAKAENQAKIEFKKVYARSAVMTNNIDENAVMVIAYGLLPLNRNLASEKTAIKTFKWVYGHAPVNALAWNIVRAIAYSGATR